MGFASWRVYSKGGGFSGKARNTLLIYIAKLLLNWMWPVIAFGLESLLGAIIEMIILLVFVILTGVLFLRFDKIASFLFIPYFGYLSFATVLCIHIYILNP
jgi:translocator protein